MQLNLCDNIKKFRKEMNLTQEELAEAFNVTVGAVSKWENGSNIPDIYTLMGLADFFNISMDILLGYNVSSKGIDDIVSRIKELSNTQRFEEAKEVADRAIIRFPSSFKIIFECAELYYILYEVGQEKDDSLRNRAIELYEKSLLFISQNEDLDKNEISIKLAIARLKSKDNSEEALKEFYKINYMGIADLDIARLLMNAGKTDEALSRYTKILFLLFIRSYEFSTSMAIALACTDKPKNIADAIDLMDWNIKFIDMTTKGSVGYFSKMKVTLLVLKGMFLSCQKSYEKMRSCIDEAFVLAKKYDKNPSTDFMDKIKFWHAGDEFNPYAYDSLAPTATESIDALFNQKPTPVQKQLLKKIVEAKKYWEETYRK